MPDDVLVIDADGHLCEPPDLWERNLPKGLRDRGIRLRWNEATGYDECWVEDRMATDRGLVGLGNAGESFDEFGKGRHYEDLNPAGFDPHERVKVLDAEGIDVSVMYPGLGLKLGAITDPDLAVASCQVYNDWLAQWCAQAPDRLVGVGALPLQDPARAADDAHWIDRMGEFLESYGWATPPLSLTPKEYFQRQCWISFDPGETTAPLLWPLVGSDRFVWASDFPHSDAKYPGVVDELREYTEGMEPVARAGLFGRNALAMYGIETSTP